MKMIAVALGREPAQDREDLLGLLGRQDGGRLVEDEDPGLAVERLEDLDPLLPADRQACRPWRRGRSRSRTARRARGSGGCASFAVEEDGLAIVSSPRTMFSATVRTGTSMKCWWTMLIPRAMASAGPVIVDRLAVEQDLALVGHGQPVEDVHQGRLAGAVLAEQGVDLAGTQVEIDRVVGEHARIALGDARASRARGGDRRPPWLHLVARCCRPEMRRAGRPRCRPVRRVGRRLPSGATTCVAGGRLAGIDVPSFIPARAASILPGSPG